MKRLLFVCHEDSLTGGPLALLRLLRIIKNPSKLSIDIFIIAKKGVLYDQFEGVADQVFALQENRTITKRIAQKFSLVKSDYTKIVDRAIAYDLIIFNTVLALNFFSNGDLTKFKRKALLIYEMPIAVQLFMGSNLNKLRAVDLIFSPAEALTRGLIAQDIPAARIKALHQYLDRQIQDEASRLSAPRQNSGFRVGMIGTPTWAKGFELFLVIAKRYDQLYPESNVKFVWKGIFPGRHEYTIYSEEVRKAGIEHIVSFEGLTDEIGEFYNSIDVLALTSREDTFPYAMMEAALWKIPTICFEQSGGTVDFVKDYDGYVIPYLSIEDYAQAVHAYYLNLNLLKQHGESARAFILKNHTDDKIISNQFYTGINELFRNHELAT